MPVYSANKFWSVEPEWAGQCKGQGGSLEDPSSCRQEGQSGHLCQQHLAASNGTSPAHIAGQGAYSGEAAHVRGPLAGWGEEGGGLTGVSRPLTQWGEVPPVCAPDQGFEICVQCLCQL